jgi:hypothetical protein
MSKPAFPGYASLVTTIGVLATMQPPPSYKIRRREIRFNFAAAWEQKGSHSYGGNDYELDPLDTVVVPFPSLNGTKFAEVLPEEDSSSSDDSHSNSPVSNANGGGGSTPRFKSVNTTAIVSSVTLMAVIALLAVSVLLKERCNRGLRIVVVASTIEMPKI